MIMARKHLKIINLIIVMWIFNACHTHVSNNNSKQNILFKIQQSHVDANIPDKNNFDNLLNQNLEEYFSSLYEHVTIKWEFLREGATQSGVANPKYYLWVYINKDNKLVDEGAVRVAASNKKSFDILEYATINQIENKSIDIYTIFPKAVCIKIESKLK